jgi:FecR protein
MKITSMTAAVLAFLAGSNGLAAEPAGRVLAVAGSATIERAGQQIPLRVGAVVENGDTLGVGDKSTLQVRFTDESVVALRANSQFKIENYKYDKNAESDRSLMGLLKGGMRTITGLIGKANNKNYLVQTATATIGIRGTHFSVVSCNNDCTRPDGTQEANGTFGSVTDGRITVSNAAGAKEFGQQDSFYVPTANSVPVQLLAPPAILSDKGAASRGRSTAAAAAQDGEASSGSGSSSGARISTSPQLVEQSAPKIGLIGRLTNLAASDNPNTRSSTASGNGDVTTVAFQGFLTSTGNGETRLAGERVAISRSVPDDADLKNAFIFNAQSTAMAVGRFRTVNSNAAASAYWYFVPPTESFGFGTHRAFGDAPISAQPTSGIAQYNYIGGTTPTDNYGRAGTFSATNASLVANFGKQTISTQTSMGMSFAANTAMPTSTVYSIPAQTFSMNSGVQTLTGVTCAGCTGTSSGSIVSQFLGTERQGLATAITVKNTQLSTVNTPNAGGNVAVFAKQ